MFGGKNNNKKERTFLCDCCDGTFEMIEECFPDDAGYSACLARMQTSWGKFCGQKESDAVKRKNNDCCS
jgi:hypothetical protein